MPRMTHLNSPSLRAVLRITVLLSLLVLSLSAVVAQDDPRDSDPVWRAFAAVRDVIEEARSVDLTYVRSYEWAQTEWQPSIDSCRDDVAEFDYRPVYFGWNFTITSLTGTVYFGRASFDLTAVVVCDREEQSGGGGGDGGGGGTIIPDDVVIGDFELGGHVVGLSADAIQAMGQSGMTWVKKQLRYSVGMDTSQAEAWLNDATANGYKLLLGVVGNPADLAGDYNAYVSTYAQYLGQLAGLGVHAIEVWNEPNIDREWPAGQINGATYTQMLRESHAAIKAANAGTLVISGAPAPTGFFGTAGCTDQGCNDDVFMQQMAEAGAANYMDCVGLHYNEGIVSPDVSSGDPRGEYPTYYFGSMTARGYQLFGGRQVCYTELGYLSGEGFNTPIPAGFAWAENVTVQNQADWLGLAAARAAQSGQVRLMIVWNVNFTGWGADPQAGYAMIRPDGTCPACATLGQVMGGG